MAQTPNQNQSPKKKWTVVTVPIEVKTLLERIKSRSNHDAPNWRLILDALSFYEALRSKPKMVEDLDKVEKISWYITKLSLAYGTFAVNPTEESMAQLIERLQEVEMRLQVDTSVVQKMVNQYAKIKDEQERKKFRIQMNQAFKMIIKEMIIKAGENNGPS